MAEIGNRTDIEIDPNLVRHMCLASILSIKQKFGKEYGNIVIACESKRNWRKEVFPYYKGNRKKEREQTGINWSDIFNTIASLKEDLALYFPYKVLEVDGAEADDIIAVLTEWVACDQSTANNKEKVLIISGDKDFVQLQKFKNVKQFGNVLKKFIKLETKADKHILKHIITGDKGDGVPNILSEDNCIVDGIRQKSIYKEMLEKWSSDPSTMPTDDKFRKNFERNKRLIDFSCIPADLKQKIIDTYNTTPVNDKSQLLNYFIAKKLKRLMEHIVDF